MHLRTDLSLWTFQELHANFYQSMVPIWNAANPSKQITLKPEVFPYDDLHNKLLVALQSGVGAPDLADIEVSKSANYLKGTIQLAPLNDLLDPIKDKFFIVFFFFQKYFISGLSAGGIKG